MVDHDACLSPLTGASDNPLIDQSTTKRLVSRCHFFGEAYLVMTTELDTEFPRCSKSISDHTTSFSRLISMIWG